MHDLILGNVKGINKMVVVSNVDVQNAQVYWQEIRIEQKRRRLFLYMYQYIHNLNLDLSKFQNLNRKWDTEVPFCQGIWG